MRPRAASTASGSASSTRCRPTRWSRSRATRRSTASLSRKGIATTPLETVGAAPNRRGTTVTFTPDPEIFGADAKFSPERLYKLARSKAYLFAGVEIRWRCDPSLASAEVPESAVFQFAERPRRPSRRAGRRAADRHQPAVRRQPGLPERPGQRRMGGRLAALLRRRRKLLLQHHPDARRRHPRGGPARRADQGHPRVRRAGRQQEGQGHHRRRRGQRRRADALDLHPQPAFPEPDQGPPDQPRSRALRRGRGARPFRPLSRRQHGPRPRAPRRDHGADGRAAEAPRRARGPAQDRHRGPQAPPPRQAHRLRQ